MTYKVIELLNLIEDKELKKIKMNLLFEGSGLKPQQRSILRIVFLHLKNKTRLEATIRNELGSGLKRLDDLMAQLLRHVEGYLVNEHIKKPSKSDHLFQLLDLYGDLNLKRHYETVLTKIEKFTEEKPMIISSNENRSYYLLLKTTEVHKKLKKGRGAKSREVEYVDYFEISYAIEKLKICCELINRNKILNRSIDMKYIESHLHFCESYRKKNLLVGIYIDIIYILLNKERITSKEFMKLFNQYKLLPFNKEMYEDNNSIASYLINICVGELKADNKNVANLLVEVVDFMKEKNLVIEQGIVSFPLMKAIVSAAIKLDHLEWAENFYYIYKNFLDREVKEVAKAYLEALFLFNKENFQQAWQKTSHVDVKTMDTLLKINFMQLQIQIAIELKWGAPIKDKEYLKAITNRLLYTLRSPKIGKTNKEKCINFIKYTKVLRKKRAPEKYKIALQNLIHESPVSEKPWLLKKLKEKAEN